MSKTDDNANVKTLLNENLRTFAPKAALMCRKSLSTSEEGKVYRIEMNPAKRCAVYQVDGEIVKVGNRCDKLVLVETNRENNSWTEVFVELKGKNVSHAIEQLRASIENPLFCHPSVNVKWARIVAQSIPRNNGHSEVERARNEFKKRNVELKAWSSSKKDTI